MLQIDNLIFFELKNIPQISEFWKHISPWCADTIHDFYYAGTWKYEGTAGAGDKTDPTGT